MIFNIPIEPKMQIDEPDPEMEGLQEHLDNIASSATKEELGRMTRAAIRAALDAGDGKATVRINNMRSKRLLELDPPSMGKR